VQWTADINSEIEFCDAEERRMQVLRPVPVDKHSKTELLKAKAAMLVLSTALAANEKFKGLTLVRRKEATITIRWLSERLDAGGFKAKSAVQGTATAYSFVEPPVKRRICSSWLAARGWAPWSATSITMSRRCCKWRIWFNKVILESRLPSAALTLSATTLLRALRIVYGFFSKKHADILVFGSRTVLNASYTCSVTSVKSAPI
jgi:hypothetical protein